MRRILLGALLLSIPLARAAFPASGSAPAPGPSGLYAGWLQMYDLRFDEAHHTFDVWKKANPADALGPASDAAAYLFSELARLGALESEFFTDDKVFEKRPKLHPDPEQKQLFTKEIDQAEQLADAALDKSATDLNAMFAKSLTLGLRADDAGLVEKQTLAALNYTKEGRTWADRLIQANPRAADAYLGPGVENYLLSLKPAPLRALLRMTGSNVDRQKGIEQLRETAAHGYFLEPFAKLLLAVADIRDKNLARAHQILGELHRRFPDNVLYTREMTRLEKK